MVRHHHFGSGLGGGQRELHPEHSRAQHDDSLPGRDGRAHVLRVGEVAQGDDAAGQRRAAEVEVVGGCRDGCAVATRALHPGECRDVRAGAGREHEPVVVERDAIVQAHDSAVTVNAHHRRRKMEPHAGLFGDAAVVHVEARAVGAADRVLGEQDAVVDVVGLGAYDGEVDAPVADRGQQPVDQPRPDGAVAHQHHTLRHADPPSSTRRPDRHHRSVHPRLRPRPARARWVARPAPWHPERPSRACA